MAGAYKKRTDRARGKAGKWTAWWLGEDGRRRYKAGTADKAPTPAAAIPGWDGRVRGGKRK